MQYKAKEVIEATRWFKNGDHPLDDVMRPYEDTGTIPVSPREGAIVRYFRHPQVPGDKVCEQCGQTMHHHGWIDSQCVTVCPGMFIVTYQHNDPAKTVEYLPMSELEFTNRFERYHGNEKSNDNCNSACNIKATPIYTPNRL